MTDMKLKLLSCEVFQPEFEQALQQGRGHISADFLPFGLHDKPEELRHELQARIDAVPPGVYGAILLGFGLCSRAVVGITARHTPLVLPKTHDCIAMLLGSRQRYDEQFASQPGTYYYSAGWIIRSLSRDGNPFEAPSQSSSAQRRFEEYVEKYGEDNARYLMEIEAGWTMHYSRVAFINTRVGDIPYYRQFVNKIAADNDWNYEELAGDPALMLRFLDGDWDNDFLVVSPGQEVIARHDGDVIGCRPSSA
jgi:hypothetical protein